LGRSSFTAETSRLMALAIYCDYLIRTGAVESQTDLDAFGHITTARMTQIMALLNLAPDIQEEILFLPLTRHGHDAIKESDVNLLINTFDWQVQGGDGSEYCLSVRCSGRRWRFPLRANLFGPNRRPLIEKLKIISERHVDRVVTILPSRCQTSLGILALLGR
jgi:hypothetical protein